MSATYRITLVQLKADASAVGSASDKLEHGTHPVEEIIRLAGKLHQLDLSSTKAEPGIIIQRGDKGWRIGVHQGGLPARRQGLAHRRPSGRPAHAQEHVALR